MLVVGIDPDSDRHGVAVYEDGKLVRLAMMRRNEIIDEFRYSDCLFSIEDVAIDNFVYAKNKSNKLNLNAHKGRTLGLCQQAQKELMRDLDHYSVPYVLHKPSKMWKNDKKQFQLVTGWKKSGNEDTRSAAYFGYLEASKK